MRSVLFALLLICLLPASAAGVETYHPRPTFDLGTPRAEGAWSSHVDARSCVLLGPRWFGRMSARTSGDRVVALGRMPSGPGGGTGLLLFPTPLQLPFVSNGDPTRIRLRAGSAEAEGEVVRLRGLGVFVRVPEAGVRDLLEGMAQGAALEVAGPVWASWSARGGAEAAVRVLDCLRG